MVWVVAFCFSFPFFFFFWLFLISSFFYKVYQEAVVFMYWTQFPGPTSLHIEPVLDTNRSIGMDFTHSTNIPIIIMTWVTWKLSEIEGSCGVVIWYVRAHSTFKWRSSLLIINRPVGICARVVFYAIYGSDEITHDAVVRAFVFVKRALFLAVNSFVHDVNQKSSFGNLCGIILWNRFINDGDIPFKLKGDWSARNEQSWVSVKAIFNFLSKLFIVRKLSNMYHILLLRGRWFPVILSFVLFYRFGFRWQHSQVYHRILFDDMWSLGSQKYDKWGTKRITCLFKTRIACSTTHHFQMIFIWPNV